MNINDAINIIDKVQGFSDDDTSCGEAWLFVKDHLARKDEWIKMLDKCDTCKNWYDHRNMCVNCINYRTNRYAGATFENLWSPALEEPC